VQLLNLLLIAAAAADVAVKALVVAALVLRPGRQRR
jgi:hypothetical protein